MDRVSYSHRFGSAEFDEARFELKVAGLPVELERRAMDVLAYLLAHAGEVVTKEELLREVWAGRITVEKVLPNAINKLRRALGDANADHISTVARVGYRLDGPVSRTVVGAHSTSALELSSGQAVPGRPNFVLSSQLAKTRGSEVWLAEHSKTREQRVYKFGIDSTRLRGLKREATLMRVLQESIEQREHFIEIIDWNFEAAPYFLECEYGGQHLGDWCAAHLSALSGKARLALFLQVADAVALAHSFGVLHKDLKPANILVSGAPDAPKVRLSDFGSGQLLEPERLEQLGITRMGMTVTEASDLTSGTPIYLAPEVFQGQVPTIRSDVYALGIVLYQLLSGHLNQPMASGWEQHVDDPLLQEDIRLATDGDPTRRLGSAAELAERLHQLEARRIARASEQARAHAAEQLEAGLARARARRPILTTLFVVLALGMVGAIWLQQQALHARNLAATELERARAVTRFLNEDLIGRSNPLITQKGADASLREVLLAARERVSGRFAEQAGSEAAIRGNLASLFNTLELWPEAEQEARRAFELHTQLQGANSRDATEMLALLVRVLSRMGKVEEAGKQFDTLQTHAEIEPGLVASAHSTLLIARAEFTQAVPVLRHAVRETAIGPTRDSLRLDLIAVLTRANDYPAARTEADSLIREARARGKDGALLAALAQLAVARAFGEDHAAMEQVLLEAKPVIEDALGTRHSRFLQLLAELQGIAFRRGDWPNAIERGLEVHERAKEKFGAEHTITATTLSNYGRSLYEGGRTADAEPVVRRAYEQLRDALGVSAPAAQDAAFLLACITIELGDQPAATALLDVLDPVKLESGRPTGTWPEAILALRGLLAKQQGKSKEAREWLTTAVAALAAEEDLAAPSRQFVAMQDALKALKSEQPSP